MNFINLMNFQNLPNSSNSQRLFRRLAINVHTSRARIPSVITPKIKAIKSNIPGRVDMGMAKNRIAITRMGQEPFRLIFFMGNLLAGFMGLVISPDCLDRLHYVHATTL